MWHDKNIQSIDPEFSKCYSQGYVDVRTKFVNLRDKW